MISVRGKSPQLAAGVFVARSADLIGDVKIGKNSSVWYQAVLRGDVMPIEIGEESNIQDGTVIHGTYKKCGTKIGDRVTVGHSVILHGCTVEDECLIGMGAVLMDKSHIPKNSIVAAGSLVTENSTFPPGHLIIGSPAKAKRPLTTEELAFLPQSAKNYQMYTSWYEKCEGDGDGKS